MRTAEIADDLADLRERLPTLAGAQRQRVLGRVLDMAEVLHGDGADATAIDDLLDFLLAGVAGHA